MHVDTGRVDTIFDAQGAVGPDGSFEFLEELGLRKDLVDSALQDHKLIGNVPHKAIELHGDEGLWYRRTWPMRGCHGLTGLPILGWDASLDKVADRNRAGYDLMVIAQFPWPNARKRSSH